MVKQSAVQDPAANGEEGLANVANGTGWLSEDFELPTWSRTLAGWRERFHLPFSLPLLPGGHKQLSIGQRPVASSSHKQEAAASADGLATGSTVWDAGIVLAAHVFARHANAGSGQLRCLDLGAGSSPLLPPRPQSAMSAARPCPPSPDPLGVRLPMHVLTPAPPHPSPPHPTPPCPNSCFRDWARRSRSGCQRRLLMRAAYRPTFCSAPDAQQCRGERSRVRARFSPCDASPLGF